MYGSDSGAGPGGEKSFWDHGHVDDDSISPLDSMLSEENAHSAHILIRLPQGVNLFLFDHV